MESLSIHCLKFGRPVDKSLYDIKCYVRGGLHQSARGDDTQAAPPSTKSGFDWSKRYSCCSAQRSEDDVRANWLWKSSVSSKDIGYEELYASTASASATKSILQS